MDDRIPKDPSWCTYCRCPEMYGEAPCRDHRGPDGKPRHYDGPNAYEPSPQALEVIGSEFKAPRWDSVAHGEIRTFVCDGYDPRSGFWMRDPIDGYQTNISERAVGRTWHQKRC